MKNLWIILLVTVLAVQPGVAVFNPPDQFWHHVQHNDKYYEWDSRIRKSTEKLYERFRKRKHAEELDDLPMLKHKLESLPDIPKSFYSLDKWPACRDSFRKDNVDEGSCDASWVKKNLIQKWNYNLVIVGDNSSFDVERQIVH
jgi:hypothetical protein